MFEKIKCDYITSERQWHNLFRLTGSLNLTFSLLNVMAIYRSCTCTYTQQILFWCCIVMCCNGNSFFVLKTFLNQKHTKYYILLPLPYRCTTHFFTVNTCVHVNKSLCSFSSGMSLGLVDCIIYRRADITYFHKYQNYAFSVLVVSC
jgi:hypothetical protein